MKIRFIVFKKNKEVEVSILIILASVKVATQYSLGKLTNDSIGKNFRKFFEPFCN